MVFRTIFPAGYERTCRACGYAWQLTRRQAKFRARRPKGFHPKLGTGMSAVYASESAFTEQLALSDQFKHCAMCGSRSWSQRPLPDYRPAD